VIQDQYFWRRVDYPQIDWHAVEGNELGGDMEMWESLLKYSIEWVETCAVNIHDEWSGPTRGEPAHCICGYTAPALYVILYQFWKRHIWSEDDDIPELWTTELSGPWHERKSTRVVEEDIFSFAVNQTVGHLWDIHADWFRCGSMEVINTHQIGTTWDRVIQRNLMINITGLTFGHYNIHLEPGINWICLTVNNNGTIIPIHHSMMVWLPHIGVAYIADAWFNNTRRHDMTGHRMMAWRKYHGEELFTFLKCIENPELHDQTERQVPMMSSIDYHTFSSRSRHQAIQHSYIRYLFMAPLEQPLPDNIKVHRFLNIELLPNTDGFINRIFSSHILPRSTFGGFILNKSNKSNKSNVRGFQRYKKQTNKSQKKYKTKSQKRKNTLSRRKRR